MKKLRKEDGIALILALLMLLVMSALAVTISFMSSVDFQTMSNYKQGQEAFLAAERCVEEGRQRFETVGIETLFFLLQSGVASDELTIEIDLPNGSKCRTGPRGFNRASPSDPAPFIQIPPPTKAFGRPVKNVSLPSGGIGGAAVVSTSFLVTGKDAGDKDKDDTDPDLNTGTEIAIGFESFIPGGASNVY
ncbi:MAG: PilX N-terminal domain-containing pilus assembly protein [Deltaproteobacteria bacterium]